MKTINELGKTEYKYETARKVAGKVLDYAGPTLFALAIVSAIYFALTE